MSVYDELFDDQQVVRQIRQKLPRLFLLAELESQRNGKVGMEVGSVREKILIALLMYKFGLDRVNTDIAITEPEIDVIVDGEPLSIKTITIPHNLLIRGVKVSWSVDAETALKFKEEYFPSCDMMLVEIRWDDTGHLYLFKKHSQREILTKLGVGNYLKLPAQGRNARGVELTGEALRLLVKDASTRKIDIDFPHEQLEYKEAYKRWLDAWRET